MHLSTKRSYLPYTTQCTLCPLYLSCVIFPKSAQFWRAFFPASFFKLYIDSISDKKDTLGCEWDNTVEETFSQKLWTFVPIQSFLFEAGSTHKRRKKKVGTLWSELGVVYLTIYTSICSYEMCTLIPHFDWGAEAEAENFIICDLHLAFFIWPTSLRLISGTRHKKGKKTGQGQSITTVIVHV